MFINSYNMHIFTQTYMKLGSTAVVIQTHSHLHYYIRKHISKTVVFIKFAFNILYHVHTIYFIPCTCINIICATYYMCICAKLEL